ncbi:hypothetical protein [Moraxella oculi]
MASTKELLIMKFPIGLDARIGKNMGFLKYPLIKKELIKSNNNAGNKKTEANASSQGR